MKKSATILLASVGMVTFAQAGERHKAKSQHAHEHGAASLNIVVEANKIMLEFESPAESIYGFEHEAKNQTEKSKIDASVKSFKSNLPSVFLLDKKLNCKLEATRVEPFIKEKESGSGEHSEFQADVVASCSEFPVGTKLKLGLSKLFPALHEVRIQVLSGEKQSGFEIENDSGEVPL